jgi:hypothetical protein
MLMYSNTFWLIPFFVFSYIRHLFNYTNSVPTLFITYLYFSYMFQCMSHHIYGQLAYCHVLSSGLFTSVSNLNANVAEHCVCSIFIGEWVWSVTGLDRVGAGRSRETGCGWQWPSWRSHRCVSVGDPAVFRGEEGEPLDGRDQLLFIRRLSPFLYLV